MFTTTSETRPPTVGTVSAKQQPMLIETSWNRSRQFGLSERQTMEFFTLSKTDLRLLSEQNRELMLHASPVMETLHEQIVDSESVVVLTDAQGTILRSIGDDSFSMHAAQVAIRPGVTWSESQKGTNAIGTAIHERLPVTVHGNQHGQEYHRPRESSDETTDHLATDGRLGRLLHPSGVCLPN